jgi:hypothetical protein
MCVSNATQGCVQHATNTNCGAGAPTPACLWPARRTRSRRSSHVVHDTAPIPGTKRGHFCSNMIPDPWPPYFAPICVSLVSLLSLLAYYHVTRGNNYPENGLVKPPRRDARALSPAGMFGGKAPLRLAAQKSRLHAPSVPMRSAPALLAPHTSGPRDVPRCGALSLLQKDAALQGGSSRNRCMLNVKLRLLTAR